MRISSHLLPLLGGAALAAGFAGCSGGGSQTPATISNGSSIQSSAVSAAGAIHPHAYTMVPLQMSGSARGSSLPKAFVDVAAVKATQGNQTILSDAGSGAVTVWGKAGQLNAILFDGVAAIPNGLTTDASETLYVAEAGLSDVIVYPKPYTAIATTLTDPAERPLDVAVSNTGVVGVTNYLTTSLQAGSVSFYAKGSTTACATVQSSNWIYFFNDAFDAAGNLYIDGRDSFGSTLIGEISGGCKATSIKTLSIANSIAYPGGVQVDHGKILIEDAVNREVFTYGAPSGGSLGSPTATTTLNGSVSPVTFAIMAGGENLWTADFNPNGSFAGKYTYPAGAAVKTLDDHLYPVGVAVNPAALP